MTAVLIFLTLLIQDAHGWEQVGQCGRPLYACRVTQKLGTDLFGLTCNEGKAIYHSTNHRVWLPGPLAVYDLKIVRFTKAELMNGYDVRIPIIEPCGTSLL